MIVEVAEVATKRRRQLRDRVLSFMEEVRRRVAFIKQMTSVVNYHLGKAMQERDRAFVIHRPTSTCLQVGPQIVVCVKL